MGEKTKLKKYQKVIKFFQASHFKTVPVKITWDYKVMSDYAKEFLSQFKPAGKGEEVYLFGFSFGAMIALITVAQIKPKVLFLCSLSPYFKEELPYIKNSWKKIVGSKRLEDFKKFSLNRLAKSVHCKTILVFGAKESPDTKAEVKRAKSINKKIKNSKLFIIPDAKHEIGGKSYLNQLKVIISKL